jgi:hypothetical protein
MILSKEGIDPPPIAVIESVAARLDQLERQRDGHPEVSAQLATPSG